MAGRSHTDAAGKAERSNSRVAKSFKNMSDVYVYARGYIALCGPSVEAAADAAIASGHVPYTAVQAMRAARGHGQTDSSGGATVDGSSNWTHHITVVSKQELQGLALVNGESRDDAAVRVLDAAHADCPADFVDLGLGSVSDSGETAFFAVIAWPASFRLRRELNLSPSDMHVTVGFARRDVHDVAKGVSTLVTLAHGVDVAAADDAGSSVAWAARLSDGCGAIEATLRTKCDGCNQIAISCATLILDAWNIARPAPVIDCGNVDAPATAVQECSMAARLLSLRATAYGAIGSADRCMADASVAVALDGNCAAAHAMIGAFLYRQKEYAEALASFNRARDASVRSTSASAKAVQGDAEAAYIWGGIEKCLAKLSTEDAPASNSACESVLGSNAPDSAVDGSNNTPSTAACDPRVRTFVTIGDGDVVKMPRNFSWLVPGCIAGISLPKKPDHIRALASEGVRLVVTIFDHPLPAELFSTVAGVRSHFIRVENYGAPTNDELHAYMREVERTIALGGAVAVHCGGGKGRAGTLLAAYMIKHGLELPSRERGFSASYQPADWAIRTLRAMRPGSIESIEQETALREYSDSLWRQLGTGSEDEQEYVDAVKADGAGNAAGNSKVHAHGNMSADNTSRSSAESKEGDTSAKCVPQARYPSTPHLPFSPAELADDDTQYAGSVDASFVGVDVVVTEKIDGGNCCLKGGEVYARTHSKPASHPWFGPTKALYAQFAHLPQCEGVSLFGENMAAVHSIRYGPLESPFYLFGARYEATGEWASWDEVEALASTLGVPTVPVVFKGKFASSSEVQRLMDQRATAPSMLAGEESGTTPEGFVIRASRGFSDSEFGRNVAKYVRQNHVQTDVTWAAKWERAVMAGQGHKANAKGKGKSKESSDVPAKELPTAGASRLSAAAAQSSLSGNGKSSSTAWSLNVANSTDKSGGVVASSKKASAPSAPHAHPPKPKSSMRNVPNLLVLAGIPGSGKSTFSSALADSSNGAWTRVCNDELRSKSECERIVGQAKGANARVIVDMCNVTPADRAQWLALSPHSGDPKRTAAVYFESNAAECVRRVRERANHPTIPQGRGGHIVESFAKRAAAPSKEEGFGTVYIVRSVDDVAALVTRFGGDSRVYRERLEVLSASAGTETAASGSRMTDYDE